MAAPSRLTETEQLQRAATLDPRAAKIFDYLRRSPSWLGEAQIAQGLKADPAQIRAGLGVLAAAGLIERAAPSEKRPMAPLYRPAPARVITVGDWLRGGDADRGYADLAAIRRDYPSVTALSDPADGADAARQRAEDDAARKAAQEAQSRALAEQQAQDEAARAARRQAKRDALAAQENGGKDGQ